MVSMVAFAVCVRGATLQGWTLTHMTLVRKRIAPLILRGVVADNPSVMNKTLQRFLEQYGKTFALTDALIKDAHTCARLELFGTPETNVMYTKTICS